MRIPHIVIGLALLVALIAACAPTGPAPIEVLESLEVSANEKDLEGIMALFSEDAVLDESFRTGYLPREGLENIEEIWTLYFLVPWITEFRDISIEGDTATFIWADTGAIYTKLWPVKVEIRKGKITFMDFYEDATTVPIEEDK